MRLKIFIILALSWILLIPSKTFAQLKFYALTPFARFLGNKNSLKNLASISSLQITAFKNEYEPCTFVVYLNKTRFTQVIINTSDLKNQKDNKISSENIDVRIVKIWKQLLNYGYKPDKITKILTPELLLTNETDVLKAKWVGNRYYPPKISSTRLVILSKTQPKQIWVTIKIPKSIPSGLYKGYLSFYEKESNKLLGKIKLVVNVLPWKLPTKLDKIFGIFYPTRQNSNHPKYEPLKIIKKEIIDIKNHGFNALGIYFDTPARINRFLEILKEINFKPTLVFLKWNVNSKTYKKLQEKLNTLGIKYFVYGIDEPNNISKLLNHINKTKILHKNKLKVMTSLTVETMKLHKFIEPLDWANYNLKRDLEEYIQEGKKKKIEKLAPIETYYWQCYLEDFVRDRLYAGIYLWKSNLNGIFPYCYMAFNKGSPYVSDERKIGKKSKIYKMFNTVYPTASGPLPTLEWEALREGIDDYRILTLLKQLNIPEDKITSLIKNFHFIGKPGKTLYTDGITPEDFMNFRRKAIKLLQEYFNNGQK